MTNNEQLSTLEQALRNDPGNAKLHYLLAAEYAQAGDYERAVAGMSRALELDTSLHTARFQLGLLHLTMARPELALEVWAPLESQSDISLRCFKHGLEALIRDDFATCLEQLAAGIRVNRSNVPLNRDMEMVMARVRQTLAQQSTPAAEDQTVRTDFSLYEQTRQ